MRRQAVLVAALVLAASAAQGAEANGGCPTLKDGMGDTNAFGYHVPDDATDITTVKVSSTKKALTAAITVVGQPAVNEPGVSRRYEVYFDTREGAYVLRGTIGNGQSRFQLVAHDELGGGGGVTAERWQRGKTLKGTVKGNTVTITAPLDDNDLPLLGLRVDVSAVTWITDGLSVGDGAVEGASMGVDRAGARSFFVGDRGCV